MIDSLVIGKNVFVYFPGDSDMCPPLSMIYEGEIDGMEAFMNKFMGINNKIYSYRVKKQNIKKYSTNFIRIDNYTCIIYSPNSEEYEIKKQIMIKGNNLVE